MTLHYHGTPITPVSALYSLAGRCFAVSHMRPDDVRRCHEIGQSVMLDNGAFSKWKSGMATDWLRYYAWAERWLACPTTWAVPPDVIDAPSQEQDALLNEWPHGKRQSAPVWHMDEPITRLCRLVDDGWSRVCIGSTGEYATLLTDAWMRRMDTAWDQAHPNLQPHPRNSHAARHAVRRTALALRFARLHRHRPEPPPPAEHPRGDGRSLGCNAVPGNLDAQERAPV